MNVYESVTQQKYARHCQIVLNKNFAYKIDNHRNSVNQKQHKTVESVS